MRRHWPWWVLLAIAAALALLAWFPARWAWAWLAPEHPQVQVGALDGSVWHGRADGVTVAGLALGKVDWRLARSALFGHVRLSVRAAGTWGTANGTLHRLDDGSLEGDDLRFTVAVEGWPRSTLSGGMQPLGTIDGMLDHWQLRHGWPTALRGTITWRDAQLRDGGESLRLGTWRADISSHAGTALQATLHDIDDAPVALGGTIEATPLGWRLEAALMPRTRDAVARRLLRRLGTPDGQGGVRVRREGGLMAPAAAQRMPASGVPGDGS